MREIAIHLEDLDYFKPVGDGCPNDIEKFADLLYVLVVNLLEAGHHAELGNGSLYYVADETSRSIADPIQLTDF